MQVEDFLMLRMLKTNPRVRRNSDFEWFLLEEHPIRSSRPGYEGGVERIYALRDLRNGDALPIDVNHSFNPSRYPAGGYVVHEFYPKQSKFEGAGRVTVISEPQEFLAFCAKNLPEWSDEHDVSSGAHGDYTVRGRSLEEVKSRVLELVRAAMRAHGFHY